MALVSTDHFIRSLPERTHWRFASVTFSGQLAGTLVANCSQTFPRYWLSQLFHITPPNLHSWRLLKIFISPVNWSIKFAKRFLIWKTDLFPYWRKRHNEALGVLHYRENPAKWAPPARLRWLLYIRVLARGLKLSWGLVTGLLFSLPQLSRQFVLYPSDEDTLLTFEVEWIPLMCDMK